MKKILSCILAVFVAISFIGCQTANSQEVIAKVNGKEISVKDYTSNLAIYKLEYSKRYGEDIFTKEIQQGKTVLESIKEQVLNKMVADLLVEEEAKKSKISVDDKEVAEKVKTIKSMFESSPEFKQISKKYPITDEFLNKQLRLDALQEKIQEKFVKETKIEEKDLKKYYEDHKNEFQTEQVKAAHILIATMDQQRKPLPADQIKAKEKLANEVLAKVKAGEDFAKLAKTYSEDPGSKVNGGDLGYFGKGVMVPEFEKTAFSLKKGEVSGLVKSDFGYHIIKVNDHRNAIPFEEAKQQIQSNILPQKYVDYIKGLEKKAKVEKFEDKIKNIDVELKSEVKDEKKAETKKAEPKKQEDKK